MPIDPESLKFQQINNQQNMEETQQSSIGTMGKHKVKPGDAINGEAGKTQEISNISAPIFILTGSSSSGKSTLIQALTDRPGQNLALGIDEYFIDFIEQKYPNEFQTLAKVMDKTEIPKALNSGELPENGKGSSTERKLAQECLHRIKEEKLVFTEEFDNELFDAHLRTVIENSREGKTIILDTPFTEKFFEHLQKHSFDGPVVHVLVYLPLEKLMERVQKRNLEPNNHRDVGLVLHDFKRLYQPVQSKEDLVVATLKRDTVLNIFNRHHPDFADERARGFNPPDKNEYLEHFGLNEEINEVQITSTYKGRINGIVSTAFEETAETVRQIESYQKGF